MDLQQLELEMHGQENAAATDVGAASTSSSKKRGPTRRVNLEVEPDIKKVLRVNEFGEPNEKCSNHKDFSTHLGVLVRAHIKITFKDIREVPKEDIKKVTDTLSRYYEFEHQSWDSSLKYVERRINEAWRNYKTQLTKKYIKGNDPVKVRDGPAPPGIPLEDWRIFVDERNTEQFKHLSARNTINRSKLKGPACLGRRSMAVLHHEMAMEMNLTSDDEVGRIDVYLKAHTSKDNILQFPELPEQLSRLYDIDPACKATGVGDALAQTVGSDSRGRMRGLGCAISKSEFKMPAAARSRAKTLKEESVSVKKDILDLKDTVAELKAWKDAQSCQTPAASGSVPRSAQASSVYPDSACIGKQCELLGWGKRGVVAHGKVHDVDPKVIVHGQTLEEGAFVVVVTEILQPTAPLWKEDAFATTLEDAGIGSIVQWGKDSLRIQ